ncbi:hypothetical protein EVAR_88010_1 [Eumeta japonica]|uniref:Uncharacterized protein n=1 Tax=Eumeta variegata TaxID=151549 RepID=A0A4C1VD23_EUMVA|nr:hypothetical protein EVAR_88010_1 [Eumeta japonica]
MGPVSRPGPETEVFNSRTKIGIGDQMFKKQRINSHQRNNRNKREKFHIQAGGAVSGRKRSYKTDDEEKKGESAHSTGSALMEKDSIQLTFIRRTLAWTRIFTGIPDVPQYNALSFSRKTTTLLLEAQSSNPICNCKECKDLDNTKAELKMAVPEKYRSRSSAY